MSDNEQVKLISEYFVRPECEIDDSKRNYNLKPAQLFFLSLPLAQIGQLFTKPQNYSPSTHLEELKLSLAQTLTHYYPFAGRLVTDRLQDGLSCISVDCKKGPGVKLIYAVAQCFTISDLTSPHKDVPLVVRSFFDLGERAINYDGHTRPLLSVQITELADGMFFGYSGNHCIVDGTSYMHFIKSWSEIFTSSKISRLPIFNHTQSLVPGKYGRNVFKTDIDPSELRDRIFKISAKSMAMIKAKAKAKQHAAAAAAPDDDHHNPCNNISSFKALSALVWRSITRATNPKTMDVPTTCKLVVDIRPRLDPPISEDCIGVVIERVWTTTTIGELLVNNLGWAAMQIHQNMQAFDEKVARQALTKSDVRFPSPNSLLAQMSGSARMNMYGPEFGLGKAVALLTGLGTKHNGKVFAFMGSQGQGSVELHFSLAPKTMDALLFDQEFLSFVSPPETRPRL